MPDTSVYETYLAIMLIELVCYLRYVGICVWQRTTRHPLFWAAYVCLIVLVVEVVRVGCILHGLILPEPKPVLVWYLEHLSFGVVAYEIVKRHVHKLLSGIWEIFM